MNYVLTMKTALEALEFFADEWGFTHKSTLPVRQNAITALRLAIEQAEKQEPVALDSMRRGMAIIGWNRAQEEPPIAVGKELWVAEQLEQFYTAPPQRQPLAYAGVTIWVGDKTVTQLVTGVEIRHEALPGMSIEFAAKKCLNLLAAHGIGGEHD